MLKDTGKIMTVADHLRQEGRQEALIEWKVEVAKNLLNEGIDPKIVEESTKLPHEKIEELKKQILP